MRGFESSFFSSLLLCETSVFSVIKAPVAIVADLIGGNCAAEHPSRRARTSAPQDEVVVLSSAPQDEDVYINSEMRLVI